MTMNANNGSEFDDIVNTETWGPYGSPQPHPVKTGPTKRGKVVLSIGAAVLAGTGILTWQHYDAAEKASQVKAQELSIQQQQIELEKLKVLSEANAKNAKTQATQDAARQKQIDACVSHNKGLIGKQFGATYSSVLADCQNQYTATGSTSGMQEAASSTDATGSDGGVSPGLLLVIGAGGALVIAVAANRGRNTNAA
jgi:hypothetical protein